MRLGHARGSTSPSSLGTDRRAEVHPSPFTHLVALAALCDRRSRSRSSSSRTTPARPAPRRRGQRTAPDRARSSLGVFAGYIALLVHSHPGSGPGVRPRGRLDLAHRRSQPAPSSSRRAWTTWSAHRCAGASTRGAGRRLGRSERPARQLRLLTLAFGCRDCTSSRAAGGEDRVVGRNRNPAGAARPALSCPKSRRYRPSMSDS